jgi:hypothetical protein
MSIRTSDLASLTGYLDEIFRETSVASIDEMVGTKIFRVEESSKLNYIYQEIYGLAGIKAVAEGQNLPRVTTSEGDTATFTQSYYGAMVAITKKTRKFCDFNEPQVGYLVKTVVDDAWQKIDQSMADVLTNGFSASNYTDVYGQSVSAACPDGVALFSASHTNNLNSTTYRNLIKDSAATVNPPISRECIVQARVDALNHKDVNGVNRPVMLDTILVSPTNYDEAMRIVNSDVLSGEFTRDYNPLKGLVKVMQWSRLTTRTGGTDTSAYWFMFDSKKVGESLRCVFAERPTLDAPEEVYENKDWEYSIDYFYTLVRAYPAFVWGSNSTSA